MKDENENIPFGKGSENFGLPGGYFQKSAKSILNKVEWEEEHSEFKFLKELRKKKGFAVPESYFDKKEVQLENILYLRLQAISKENSFKIPDGYFEKFAIKELSQGFSGDENFEKLSKLKKQNNFSIPENYFSANKNKLADTIYPKEVRIISLFKKRIAFAAAALILVVIGLWLYTIYSAPVTIEDCGTIACLDKKDLVKTNNLENLDDEELYELVDPTALEKKLDGTENSKPETNKDNSLQDISTEELMDNI